MQFTITLPEGVSPKAFVSLVSATVSNIPVATRLTGRQAEKLGFVLSPEEVQAAVVFMRAWTDAQFARVAVVGANGISVGVVRGAQS